MVVRRITAETSDLQEVTGLRALEIQLNADATGETDGIALVDPQGRVICYNSQLTRLLELDSDQDCRGQHWSSLLKRCAGDGAPVTLAEENAAGREFSIPVFELRIRGVQERLLLVRSAPMLMHPRLSLSRLWALTDITNERRLREHAAHSEKIRINAQLAGGVAHEINNALTSILGNLDLTKLLCESMDLKVQHGLPIADHLQAAEDGARRIHRLVNDLRQFGSRPPAVLRPGILSPLLEKVRSSLKPDNSVRVTLQLDPAHEPWLTCFDESALFHAISALCSSIQRDLGTGGGTISISTGNHVDPRDGSHWVRLSVVDRTSRELNTEPIAGDQSASAADMFGGTLTLSLAMVYAIVYEMKGRLSVVARPPDGREICLMLPRADFPEQDDSRRPNQSLRILVVDDDPTVVSVCQNMLELLGHRVTSAAGGRDALQQLRGTQRFDVVLMDESMPGMSGRQTLVQLREQGIQTPVVLFTGCPEDSPARSAAPSANPGRQAEPEAYLKKPFRLQELRSVIEGLVLCQLAERELN